MIGRAIHPDLSLVDCLGTKLSKADNKSLTISCPAWFNIPIVVLNAEFASFLAVLTAEFASFLAELTIPLMPRFCIWPDWISSEVGAKLKTIY